MKKHYDFSKSVRNPYLRKLAVLTEHRALRTMRINPPTWNLTLPCPCRDQGGPMLVSCSKCGHLAAACEEVGTFFPDPRRLEASEPIACPSCGATGSESFIPAAADQVQSAGFKPGQYE